MRSPSRRSGSHTIRPRCRSRSTTRSVASSPPRPALRSGLRRLLRSSISKSTGAREKQVVLSVEPIGSQERQKSTMFTVGNQRHAERGKCRIDRQKPVLCTVFQLLCVECQRLCPQYPRTMLEISAHKFSVGIHPRAAWARAAGLAVGRHLLQKRHQQFRRLHACLTSAKRRPSGPTSARRGSPRA